MLAFFSTMDTSAGSHCLAFWGGAATAAQVNMSVENGVLWARYDGVAGSAGSGFNNGKLNSYAWSCPANATVDQALMYGNGALLASTSPGTNAINFGSTWLSLGWAASVTTAGFIGLLGPVFFWSRQLSLREIAALNGNPWQLFLPPRRRVYSLPASTSDSGSAAITESADIVSATGALSVAGTAAITEQPDTVSAIGALSVSGTASITEGSDTVSATGTLSVAGVAAIFEGGDIVAASGAIAIAGSAAITEADDTVGASGYGGTVVQGASVLSPVAIRQSTLSLAIRQSTLTVIQ